jgi:hypothetical protein
MLDVFLHRFWSGPVGAATGQASQHSHPFIHALEALKHLGGGTSISTTTHCALCWFNALKHIALSRTGCWTRRDIASE